MHSNEDPLMKSMLSTVVGLAGMLAVMNADLVRAQDYPNRPIKIVAPYPPGGQADVVGRLLCQHLTPFLNQQCVIENRPGAGGVSGTEIVVKAQPDGYTLLVADSGQWAVAPAMMAKAPYDPVKDLAPVGMVTTSSMFIAVHSSVPANTLAEFVALVRSKPGTMQYGSSGNATVHHLAMETFKATMGLDMQHVPYKGAGQSVPALVSGQIPVVLAGLTNLMAFVKTGQVKVIGATTQKRSPLAPNVAGMAEVGATGVDFPGELGLFAPAGTPRPIIEKLSSALRSAAQTPEFATRTNAVGVEPAAGTPEQLAEIIRVDQEKYRRAIKVSAAKVE
jgi:tripartite-type tricarboxylate transporter receptor subunit TctC